MFISNGMTTKFMMIKKEKLSNFENLILELEFPYKISAQEFNFCFVTVDKIDANQTGLVDDRLKSDCSPLFDQGRNKN
jgi:hypothetical protein